MKFVMEFEVDNAFFHMLVADYGRTIARTGKWSGKIMEGNGNSVGEFSITGR